jgi:hypothetical protein
VHARAFIHLSARLSGTGRIQNALGHADLGSGDVAHRHGPTYRSTSMHKILLAALMGASVLAVPAFAQVYPAGTSAGSRSSAQAGVATTGAPTNTAIGAGATTDATADPSSTPALGLGDLLKQAQASDPNAAADTVNDGAEPTASPNPGDARTHTRKPRTHGH